MRAMRENTYGMPARILANADHNFSLQNAHDHNTTCCEPGQYDRPPTHAHGVVCGYCATPQKTCQLYSPAEVGVGCSCRAPAGLPRFRGSVVP